ncbi:MAG: L-threonylcarbamoyladenylate synthase [Rhodospirillales bacterium]|nr:L-threonylcarbamoyladenylate synthase [Rhodospirillales bacterium]
METLRLTDNAQSIKKASALINQEALVAFPTETVYGLGADARSDEAVAKIFEAKSRPQFNPLIVHGQSKEFLSNFVEFTPLANKLAQAFWPGSLTLVLKRKVDCPISLLVSAGLDSIAVRVPDHPLAQNLLRQSQCPIAAPSANRSGEVSPTSAEHVLGSLESRIAAVLDGGSCRVGIESTVVDLSSDKVTLLRPGGVAAEDIEAVIGPLARPSEDPTAPKSPGMLARHYAPNRPVCLNSSNFKEGDGILGFGPKAPKECLNLSPKGDLVEAAANLFAMMRQLDKPKFDRIAVMPIPNHGLGEAINDRLKRAATPQ